VNRVPVLDGHLEAVTVRLNRDFEEEEIVHLMNEYTSRPQELKLPHAPIPPIVVREEQDRPQPRLDRNAGDGMAVSVGRIQRKQEKVLRFYCLSHNTIRGAAGASVLNAELALKEGLL
jgi:aspartate-semialdehyde dehydrogenase